MSTGFVTKTRRSLGLLALFSAVALCVVSSASAKGLPNLPNLQPALAPAALPSDLTAASPSKWIVGANRPLTPSEVRQYRARRIGDSHSYRLPAAKARALAGTLRGEGAYVFSERDVPLQKVAEPFIGLAAWRGWVTNRLELPPQVGSGRIVAIDSAPDLSHEELSGGNFTSAGGAITDHHGTAVASVMAAPFNDRGFAGVWPGARVHVSGPAQLTCGTVADAIYDAVKGGASVLNMSFGANQHCWTLQVALMYAYAAGTIPVAAAGNEHAAGNPLMFPASYGHVTTVGSIGPDSQPSYFSSTSAAVDFAAPGDGIFAAIPLAFDTDGTPDGYGGVSGTSFAAPMVTAALAWLRDAKPNLSPYQVTEVMRRTAIDIYNQGWDEATGYGLPSPVEASKSAVPVDDRSEPNDDIAWVDGTAFGKPNAAIFKKRTKSILASLNSTEDPLDVYRVTVSGRTVVRIDVKPRVSNVDAGFFAHTAKTAYSTKGLIAAASRKGTKTDRMYVKNHGKRTLTGFLVLYVPKSTGQVDPEYRVTVSRSRRYR